MIRPIRAVAFEARFDATPAQVWQALTDSRALANWFAPHIKAGQGVGETVEMGWDPAVTWPTQIEIWDPERQLRWADDMPPAEDGTPQPRLFVDWSISTENGQTVLRIVHSGFGEGAKWDDQIDGLTGGWAYFLWNMDVSLTRHRGVDRTMVSARPKSAVQRGEFWEAMFDSGFITRGASDRATIRLGDESFEMKVRTDEPGKRFAAQIPTLNDALLFIEFEGAKDTGFHAGFWLSTYGVAAEKCVRLQQVLTDTTTKLSSGAAATAL